MIFSVVSYSCLKHSCFFSQYSVDHTRMQVLPFCFLISSLSVAFCLFPSLSCIRIFFFFSWKQVLIFFHKSHLFLLVLRFVLINSLISIFLMPIILSVMSFFIFFAVSFIPVGILMLILFGRVSGASRFPLDLKLPFWGLVLFSVDLINDLWCLQYFAVFIEHNYQMLDMREIHPDDLCSTNHWQIESYYLRK